MRLLAIDTATEACSAALYLHGEVLERFAVGPRRHGDWILAMLEGLLAEASLGLRDLDALAFGRGPGAFTGVRIATGVIQGLALGASLPVVPVSNLAALAQRQFRERGARLSLTALDARMGEVYWAAYAINPEGHAQLVGEEEVATPERVALPTGEGWHGVGSGWGAHGAVLAARLGPALAGMNPDTHCHAHDLALLGVAGYRAGQAVAAVQALPVYLRDRVTWPQASAPAPDGLSS